MLLAAGPFLTVLTRCTGFHLQAHAMLLGSRHFSVYSGDRLLQRVNAPPGGSACCVALAANLLLLCRSCSRREGQMAAQRP